MSSPPRLRRVDRLMSEEQARLLLQQGFCGRLATVSADGSPYCVPLLYVVREGRLYAHNTIARGHLRANVGTMRIVSEPKDTQVFSRH